MIECQIIRMLKSRYWDEIWIATTSNQVDRRFLDLQTSYPVKVFQGDEIDVLSRFEKIIELESPDWVVRLTGDNPLTCPILTGFLVEQMKQDKKKQWLYSDKKDERKFPQGMVPELVSSSALMSIRGSIGQSENFHLSHVTSAILKAGIVS